MYKDKCVLITGAAGTIGSELACFIYQNNPSKLILLDSAETPLFNLEEKLKYKENNTTIVSFVLGSITNKLLIQELFKTYSFDFLFHTAAYKHVPLLEKNPIAGVEVNCFGTKILADAAVNYKVKNFLFISTDKVVEPANVMGATKLIAENYINSLSYNNPNSTKFITLRFGNIIGSNGSVIPLFKYQLNNNQPITVTHQDATRYFIEITKVVDFINESLKFAKSGDRLLINMGKPQSILKIAKQTIKDLNLEEKNVRIDIIGLRPGEKLHEKLLANHCALNNTKHPEIFQIMGETIEPLKTLKSQLKTLKSLNKTQNHFDVVRQLKLIVKNFKSHNSRFEILD